MIRYCTLYLFFIQTLFFTILNGGLVTPSNNSELNYIHVLFEWDQVPGASSYNIEIAFDSQFNEIIKVATVTSLVFIEEESIDWDSNYYWRVRPNYDSPFIVTGSIHSASQPVQNVRMRLQLFMMKII